MPRTLLIVDHDKDSLQSLAQLLQTDGYHIFTAATGVEGLRLLADSCADVVISDQNMPGMSGVEFLSRVKKLYPATVRLILSNELENEMMTEAVNRGSVNKFLPKPWVGQEVRRQVSEAFQLQELAWRNSRLSRVFGATSEGIVVTDASGTIQAVNPAFTRLTEFPAAEVIGKQVPLLFREQDNSAQLTEMWQVLVEGGQWHGEVICRSRDGSRSPLWLSVNAVRDREGRIGQLLFSMLAVSAEPGQERYLDYTAYHDLLTNLPNRLLFKDRLEMALAHAKRNQFMVGIIFLDLDRFKIVNDTLGYDTGDQLLRKVAGRLTEWTRREDTVARLSSDEFTILIPRITKVEDTITVSRKILKAFANPFQVDERELFITPSLGISIFPENGSTSETLMRNAETARRWAKEQGGNCYAFYTPTIHASAFERFTLVHNLHRALDQNEFVLHFQPQIDLQTGQINVSEALIRWNHPELGLLPPAKFIPLAEESGLIVPIGAWTLHHACKECKRWFEAGFTDLHVAVNISARLFSEANLVEIIKEVLEETGLAPCCLELEITESILMQQAAVTVTVLDHLKAMGIKISMDDFGTGYSSLSYLKRFPLDSLKIDKVFIRDITENPDDAAIVTAIIAMAHSMKLKVVAEGVEHEEQLSFLRDHQCDRIQGHYASMPLPADEYRRLLASGKRQFRLFA